MKDDKTTQPAHGKSHAPHPTTAHKANAVSITASGFSPKDIEIKKGTEVEWTNDDTVVHTIAWDPAATGTAPPSGDISPGSSFGLKFDTAGTFTYKCEKHPGMTGSVKVS